MYSYIFNTRSNICLLLHLSLVFQHKYKFVSLTNLKIILKWYLILLFDIIIVFTFYKSIGKIIFYWFFYSNSTQEALSEIISHKAYDIFGDAVWRVYKRIGRSELESWRDSCYRREETQRLANHSTVELLNTRTSHRNDPFSCEKCQLCTNVCRVSRLCIGAERIHDTSFSERLPLKYR